MNILYDTREKKPWAFDGLLSDDDDLALQSLKHGDYSLDGLSLIIERKASVLEIAKNICEDRFWKLVDKLAAYDYAFIICEFAYSDVFKYPYGTTLNKTIRARIRIKPEFIISRLVKIQVHHGVHTILAGSRRNAEKISYAIMKKVWHECVE